MTPEELNALADRVERLEGADREVDAEIWQATSRVRLTPISGPVGSIPGIPSQCPRYTASMDAAMTLVPDGWWWKVGECSISSDATVGPDIAHCPKDMLIELDDGIDVVIEPPSSTAIALTAACLRAHAYLALRARNAS
ncbi:hypothetical protein [Sphingobium abikonense]|uniref:hypothetical protein n=1 Tax=Sphingobium abikonense TaxID=86193 RepID=UPI0035154343